MSLVAEKPNHYRALMDRIHAPSGLVEWQHENSDCEALK